MKKILVVAPHPDDETLGCGGTLLKLREQGVCVHWLIVTTIDGVAGFSQQRVDRRRREIELVAAEYGFDAVHECRLSTAQLDTFPKSELVGAVARVIASSTPDTVFLPYRNDVHSDHAAVFDAVVSATKTFRAPFVRSTYAYETLSETEFGIRPDDPGFRPNLYIDISGYLDKKIAIMSIFESEMKDFPFPRSDKCIRALATLRGAQASCDAAEAFMILKEIR